MVQRGVRKARTNGVPVIFEILTMTWNGYNILVSRVYDHINKVDQVLSDAVDRSVVIEYEKFYGKP
jgi:hypothetical protein